MKKKYRRLIYILSSLCLCSIGVGLILNALNDEILYFYCPTEFHNTTFPASKKIRVGGLVEKGSVSHEGTMIYFRITDGKKVIPIQYKGILPTLFREGQGVIAIGTEIKNKSFNAEKILAKHDENYKPKELKNIEK